jgi:hypothetical protein
MRQWRKWFYGWYFTCQTALQLITVAERGDGVLTSQFPTCERTAVCEVTNAGSRIPIGLVSDFAMRLPILVECCPPCAVAALSGCRRSVCDHRFLFFSASPSPLSQDLVNFIGVFCEKASVGCIGGFPVGPVCKRRFSGRCEKRWLKWKRVTTYPVFTGFSGRILLCNP